MFWGQFPNPRLVVTTVKMTVICNKLPGEMWLLMGECSSSEGEGGKTDGNVLGTLPFYWVFLITKNVASLSPTSVTAFSDGHSYHSWKNCNILYNIL